MKSIKREQAPINQTVNDKTQINQTVKHKIKLKNLVFFTVVYKKCIQREN